ncbi:MAG: hypothetical protein IJZ51_11120 [Ruminiclostridium sp.]|nr:hypothetical protein [Ruminiclostridium sp.]
MISFDDITKLFSIDLNNRMCIEIEFNVISYPDYQYCWMGKCPKQKKSRFIALPLPTFIKGKHIPDIYWFGLPNHEDDNYCYNNFDDFSSAPIFDGKTLKEIWDNVEILSIDSIDPEERLQWYLQKSEI